MRLQLNHISTNILSRLIVSCYQLRNMQETTLQVLEVCLSDLPISCPDEMERTIPPTPSKAPTIFEAEVLLSSNFKSLLLF